MSELFGQSRRKTSSAKEEHWISMSDLMAGLMMVFLLISIAFMLIMQKEKNKVMAEKDKIREIAVTYQTSQVALYQALEDEFKDDLLIWDAEIDKNTLEFRFKSPEVLFATGEVNLRQAFKDILNDFFPRYIQVIKNFKENIAEVRIEGHTSSIWNMRTSADQAYFNNMDLSQGRTRSVLQYVYLIPEVATEKEWIKSKFAALGYSSSQLVFDANGMEDTHRSQRVTFKVFTNAETQIRKIIAE